MAGWPPPQIWEEAGVSVTAQILLLTREPQEPNNGEKTQMEGVMSPQGARGLSEKCGGLRPQGPLSRAPSQKAQ